MTRRLPSILYSNISFLIEASKTILRFKWIHETKKAPGWSRGGRRSGTDGGRPPRDRGARSLRNCSLSKEDGDGEWRRRHEQVVNEKKSIRKWLEMAKDELVEEWIYKEKRRLSGQKRFPESRKVTRCVRLYKFRRWAISPNRVKGHEV